MTISIVTINRDNREGLKATIDSVLMQTLKPSAHIIIDGASMDGSVELIRTYQDHIHYWVSEPDQGVYEAQNKGLARVSTHYVLFLNSGDRFCSPQSLEHLATGIKKGNELIYGNIVVEDQQGGTWLKTYPDHLPANYFDYESLPHPATLIPTKLLKGMGGYDTRFTICADWKFFRHVIMYRKVRPVAVPEPISFFAANGVSSRREHEELIAVEKQMIRQVDRYKPGILQRVESKLRRLF